MKSKLIIAIAVFWLVLIVKLVVDLNLYFKGGVNHHILGPVIVAVALAGCSLLAGWRSAFMWFLCFWALMDSMYALFIGEGLFYVGTTAWLDILQRQAPAILWMKYIGAIASTVYFISYKNKQHAT